MRRKFAPFFVHLNYIQRMCVESVFFVVYCVLKVLTSLFQLIINFSFNLCTLFLRKQLNLVFSSFFWRMNKKLKRFLFRNIVPWRDELCVKMWLIHFYAKIIFLLFHKNFPRLFSFLLFLVESKTPKFGCKIFNFYVFFGFNFGWRKIKNYWKWDREKNSG